MEPDDYTNNIDGYDGQAIDPASFEEANKLLREEQVQSIQPVNMLKEKRAPKWHPLPTRGYFIGFSCKHPQPSPGGVPCVSMCLSCLLWTTAMIGEGLKRLYLR
jgi:hypothetical protein